MALSDHKITDAAIAEKGVVAAPDQLSGSARTNKMLFDRLIREAVKEDYNGLIDALMAATGAGEIGAAVDGLSGATIQAILNSVKTALDSKISSAVTEAALELKSDKDVTNKHIKSVELDEATGTFTFTRENGTKIVIDTALEKVAVNFTYDEDSQSLLLTLADGSTETVSLAAFVTTTEFDDSSTIEWSVSGSKVKATVKEGSITDTMLSGALKSMLLSYVNRAASSATAAKASEDAAAGSATSAGGSASAAATSAQTATDAASTASTAAEAASGSASRAQASAAAAAESAASVDGINKTAQSWAVGGTGTREGEDTNNAKYWAEQARQAVGGVVSFNGRAGSVVPQAGDYDKEMVGLGNVDNTSDLEKPISVATQTALNAKPSMVNAEIPKGRMRGDVDGDGRITNNDKTLIENASAYLITLTGADLWCADVNANGSVTAADAQVISIYLNGSSSVLTSVPTFADYYNNWTYVKVDNLTGYWVTELSIPDITEKTEGSILCSGTGFTGTFIKAETFSGGVRIYANYPPIEALPCTISYYTGAGGKFTIARIGVTETYVQNAVSSSGAKYAVVKLTASGWSEGKEQTISVPGVKGSILEQLIIPTQEGESIEKYYSAGIRISARDDNTLTFSCETIPTANIFVVLVIIPIVGKFGE